jgi:uncharacterized protein (TIGR03545 family)
MVKLFRWKAIVPLAVFLALFFVLWMLFADRIIRGTIESTASSTLGTEVDLGFFRLRETDAAMDLGALQVANPSDPTRNLLEASTIVVDLNPVPALEKKVVVERLTLSGLRFGTTRKTPARPAPKDSPSRELWDETRQWAQQAFQLPKLGLQRVDTVKSLVLDPAQLATVKAAAALAGQLDSTRTALTQNLQLVQIKPLTDSATALTNRLAKTDPKTLGVTGAATAVSDVKRTLDRITAARKQLADLEKSATASLGVLNQGLQGLDAARQKDYDFARSLLNLPLINAPDIGEALFGQQSVDYFQQALYYARLAQKYLPPGLRPLERSGPKRLRMAGTTVDFPRLDAWPTFLVERGNLDFAFGKDTTAGQFKATLAGWTTQPALYGKPATVEAAGNIGGANPIRVNLSGLSDHVSSVSRDQVKAQVQGLPLPAFEIPGLPFSVAPGRSNGNFAFSLEGDRIAGTWSIASSQAAWTADSAQVSGFGLVENTIWRVVSGLNQLQVAAELSGTVSNPVLRVSSNIDQAIAGQLKAVAGQELAKGEAKARAAVDKVVNEKTAPLVVQVNDLKGQAATRLGLDRSQLDDAQRQLEVQLKRYGGGLGGIKLPSL